MKTNQVQLLGNLGADPELRYTQSGTPVANFRIATNEFYTKDGKREERTEWHRIVVWGKLAENCGKYLQKGRQVVLQGSLRTRRWEDREGITRYTTEVVASNVTFLGGRSQEAPQAEVDPSVSEDSKELLNDDQPF